MPTRKGRALEAAPLLEAPREVHHGTTPQGKVRAVMGIVASRGARPPQLLEGPGGCSETAHSGRPRTVRTPHPGLWAEPRGMGHMNSKQ